jgi:hypothetical protein
MISWSAQSYNMQLSGLADWIVGVPIYVRGLMVLLLESAEAVMNSFSTKVMAMGSLRCFIIAE